MIKIILLLNSLSLFTFANDASLSPQLIFSFEETSGYTYFLPATQVRAGYSAQLVADGHFVGSVITPEKSEIDINEELKMIFKKLLEADRKNLEKLSELKEDISTEIDGLKDKKQTSSGQPSKNQTKTPPTKLDWDAYTGCAKKIIPFLRQSIVFLHKSKTDNSVLPSYYLTKSLVDELSDKNGVACGQHLGSKLELQLNGHIRNIKVLTAFLKRSKDERKILLQTLTGAFSKKSPSIIKNQFAYYFARQFFVAAVTSEPIPAYEVLNQELRSAKETTSYSYSIDSSPFGEINFKGEVVNRYSDIDDNYNIGMKFLKGLIK